jgi:hypothetical protein
MNLFFSIAMLVTAVGFFVYGLYKHEQRLQEMERKISETQTNYLNAAKKTR